MSSLRFSHLGICVSDLDASIAFYRDALGFEPAGDLDVKGEPGATLLRLPDVELRAVYLRRDGVTIELLYYASPGHEGDGAPRRMNALGLTHLSLRVDDLEGMLADLDARGVNVLRDTYIDNPSLSARAVFLIDPDGTLIELVEMRAA